MRYIYSIRVLIYNLYGQFTFVKNEETVHTNETNIIWN